MYCTAVQCLVTDRAPAVMVPSYYRDIVALLVWVNILQSLHKDEVSYLHFSEWILISKQDMTFFLTLRWGEHRLISGLLAQATFYLHLWCWDCRRVLPHTARLFAIVAFRCQFHPCQWLVQEPRLKPVYKEFL